MNLLNFVIGVKTELKINDKDRPQSDFSYTSQLIDIHNDNILELAKPISKSKYKNFPQDSLIDVFFYHETHGLMSFTGKVIFYSNQNKNSLFLLLNSEIKKEQRRNYERYDYSIDIKYSTTKEKLYNLVDNEELMISSTTNISAGGLLATLSEPYDRGTKLYIELIFSNNNIKLCGEVMRSTENKYYLNEYETGIKFIEINKNDHEYLIRYIYEIQKPNKN